MAGLRDRSGRGRKPILSPEEQKAVAQRLEAGPQAGDVCSLRDHDFRQFIQDQVGKRMSVSAVDDLLHDLPPDSPELNGIEIIWHDLRSHCWSNRSYTGYDERFDVATRSWCQHGLNADRIKSVCPKSDIPTRR